MYLHDLKQLNAITMNCTQIFYMKTEAVVPSKSHKIYFYRTYLKTYPSKNQGGVIMIEYNGFMSSLRKELLELRELSLELNEKLKNAPEGSLNILKKQGRPPQYYHYLGNRKRVYISQKNKQLALAIAQKEYDQEVLSIISKRIRCIEKLEDAYKENESHIYEQLSNERKILVTRHILSDQDYIEQWYKQHPGGQNSYPNSKPFYTNRGEIVRSKSEKILADLFSKLKIPYVYEPMLELSDGTRLCPDFMLLNKGLRRTIIYEHFGMMNDPQYVGRTSEKIHLYEKNGYWPGHTLLFSMESMEKPLDIRLVEDMLKASGLI